MGFVIFILLVIRLNVKFFCRYFPPDSLCLGVSMDVVWVLLTSNQDHALSYNCCSCRFQRYNQAFNENSGLSDNGAMKQLLFSVGEIAREVRELKSGGGISRSTRLNDNREIMRNLPNTNGANLGVGREQVFQHLVELREREKRVNSIVLRGLGDVSPG